MNMIDGLQDHVEDHLSLLTPIEQAWQPTDYLPDLTAEDWSEQLGRFRETRTACPTNSSSSSWGTWSPRRRCRTTRSRSSTS